MVASPTAPSSGWWGGIKMSPLELKALDSLITQKGGKIENPASAKAKQCQKYTLEQSNYGSGKSILG